MITRKELNELIYSDRGKLYIEIMKLLDYNNDLSRKLQSQIELNRNLIRISIERQNKKNGLPTKSPGYKILGWKQTTSYCGSKWIPCIKLKILTPYSSVSFNLDDIILLEEKSLEQLELIIGKITYIDDSRKINNLLNEDPTINYFWGITYEGNIEYENSIIMNMYCSQPPIIKYN